MFTLIMIATFVPVVVGVSHLALRNRRPQFLEDVGGIALQTVIVIVVLLAIAGAVAGVLVSRGDDAVDTLGSATIGDPSFYDNQTDCEEANFTWNDGDGSNTDGDSGGNVQQCE